MSKPPQARRVIQVNKCIIGPGQPREKTVRVKKAGDYPGVASAHLDVAKKLSSPLALGPPVCDELIAFVCHTFTEEEARVVRRLSLARGRDARQLARAEGRPLEEIEPILQGLAVGKRAIASSGEGDRRRYKMMPVMPGIFEMVLIGESPQTLTDWHRRFAELIEALFETGYMVDYQDRRTSMIRFMPVAPVVAANPAALPSDRLEVVLDRYQTFGVGHCQCRMSDEIADRGCGKPLEVCTVMGEWAQRGIDDGWLRSVSRDNILQIKREAESQGLVTWIMNVESARGQVSCSCCGCCCKAMRGVNEFNAPGAMAPPHFMPKFDSSACTHCGSCAKKCPMGAITVDTREKTLTHQPARCIGCGLCMLGCEKEQAIKMDPVPDYRLPYKSWLSMLTHDGPTMLKASWKTWRQR
jgi:Na+-translocating ferredoxin:NAD+ oxidoreductase subunit B